MGALASSRRVSVGKSYQMHRQTAIAGGHAHYVDELLRLEADPQMRNSKVHRLNCHSRMLSVRGYQGANGGARRRHRRPLGDPPRSLHRAAYLERGTEGKGTAGASVKDQDKTGATPAHYAAQKNSVELMRTLRE